MTEKELQPLMQMAFKAALEAGKIIVNIYEDEDFKTEYKSDNSPITIADKRANSMIQAMLRGSGIPVLSEESEIVDYSIRKTWKRLWIVDPLDGTKEFVNKNGEFTVNIALIEDGKPIFGIVYAPVLKSFYWGGKDLGLHNYPLTDTHSVACVCTIEDKSNDELNVLPEKFTVVASRSHISQETNDFIKVLEEKHGEADIINIGSSLKFYLLATKKAHYYPRCTNLHEWDIAAGHAVAEGGGCIVTDIDGNDIVYNTEDVVAPKFIVRNV